MSSNPEHFKLGVFVLTGLGLLVAGILFFSTGALGEQIYQIETYINESVHGLEVGSPVKHRGKKIGTVNDISFVRVEYDLRPEDPQFSEYGRYVVVRMTIDNPPFRTDHPDQVTGVVAQEIRNGLRTRLASQGITGLMYIEIDYVDPERNPALATSWVPMFDYIPSTTSTITRLLDSAENVFTKLEDTNLGGVADALKDFLVHADETLAASDVPARSEELGLLMQELHARLSGPEIDAMLADAAAATASLRELAAAAEAEVPPMLADLRVAGQELRAGSEELGDIVGSGDFAAALEELPQVATQLRGTLQRLDLLLASGGRDATDSLENLERLTRNLAELSELLQRYPALALWGAPPPELGD